MTARVCCALIVVLLCLSVCLSTTDARRLVTVKQTVQLDEEFIDGSGMGGIREELQKEHLLDTVNVAKVCAHYSDCPNNEKCCRTKCALECTPLYEWALVHDSD